ncbi:glycoside hydrolase family 16 protein [Candidatus Saccharibacteria bacterium]|nr:glycoside hydrolase family 16 protein [Candidatus Saccharibacteria bacterium]
MSRSTRRLQFSARPVGGGSGDVLSTLIASSPPAGVSPAPVGPMVGTSGQFDYTQLATNEVWDHFDGTTLDDRLWQRDYINQGGTQVYHDPGLYLDGSSHAVMECTSNAGTIYSGRFTSRERFAMQYGWCAARIKMPHSIGSVGRSWFPAFWLLLVDYNLSPNYAEFDIMEQFGDSSTYSTHLYTNDGGNDLESYVDVPVSHSSDASQAYHTYWMLWESNRIRVGVDQVMMGDWSPSDMSAGVWALHMQQPMYYILNFAAAPNWLPAPQPSDFPAQMLVDWVWYKPLSLL